MSNWFLACNCVFTEKKEKKKKIFDVRLVWIAKYQLFLHSTWCVKCCVCFFTRYLFSFVALASSEQGLWKLKQKHKKVRNRKKVKHTNTAALRVKCERFKSNRNFHPQTNHLCVVLVTSNRKILVCNKHLHEVVFVSFVFFTRSKEKNRYRFWNECWAASEHVTQTTSCVSWEGKTKIMMLISFDENIDIYMSSGYHTDFGTFYLCIDFLVCVCFWHFIAFAVNLHGPSTQRAFVLSWIKRFRICEKVHWINEKNMWQHINLTNKHCIVQSTLHSFETMCVQVYMVFTIKCLTSQSISISVFHRSLQRMLFRFEYIQFRFVFRIDWAPCAWCLSF